MTDRMKINQAIAVLEELERRHIENVPLKNLVDLKLLLQKTHTTCGSEDKTFSSEAETLARKLLACIRERKSTFREPNLHQWSLDMDKLIRLDKRSVGVIEEVVLWSQYDTFWQNNILSPTKLRKHFDRLEMAMERDNKWKRNRSVRTPDGKTARDRYLESLESVNEDNQGIDG